MPIVCGRSARQEEGTLRHNRFCLGMGRILPSVRLRLFDENLSLCLSVSLRRFLYVVMLLCTQCIPDTMMRQTRSNTHIPPSPQTDRQWATATYCCRVYCRDAFMCYIYIYNVMALLWEALTMTTTTTTAAGYMIGLNPGRARARCLARSVGWLE